METFPKAGVTLPVLGVGLTYFSGIEPILESHAHIVDLIEVEPQTLWYCSPKDPGLYRVEAATLERIAALPCAKLLHGIGFPIGGVRAPDPRQIPLLRRMISTFAVPWMSEHLSFNRAEGPGGPFNTGFLLPPRQSNTGVAAAAESIRSMADQVRIPLAVETGVNYLRPRADELPDGVFVAKVARAGDCGILLDLHNVWTNARNGRQPLNEFLEQIPLDRVWEVHLAGGLERHGYWLDSHSGAIPEPLLEVANEVIPRLPNVRALVFELFPPYLPLVGLDAVRTQIEVLHDLWERRASGVRYGKQKGRDPDTEYGELSVPTPEQWEDTLGALVVRRDATGSLAVELSADPGLAVVQELLDEFRASMIVSALQLTSRLLMLTLGEKPFWKLLSEFWKNSPPELFASSEAEGFGEFLAKQDLDVSYLSEVLEYERAALAATIHGDTRVVTFRNDPLPLLRALTEGRMPAAPAPGWFEIEITPERAGGRGLGRLATSH